MSLRSRQRPAYLRLLAAILGAYALIIAFGDTGVGAAARVGLLGILLWASTRLRTERRLGVWAVVVAGLALLVTAVASAIGGPRLVGGVVGACSTVLIGLAVVTIASTLRVRGTVDVVTVLGVLCIYLLFALFFASVHQVFGAFSTEYLNGTDNPASGSDLLYFSVITIATVGFGDITPASEIARAVTVVEALTGQLYLVSVVAGVVGGWRRPA